MAETSSRATNLKDLVVPLSMVLAFIGGAWMIQGRLLGVEYSVRSVEGSVESVKDLIRRETQMSRERLALFASTLREMNPSIKVPEIK